MKQILFTIIFFLLLHARATGAERERWAFLVATSNGSVYEYDTRTYESNRNGAGGWIRFEMSFPEPGTRSMFKVAVGCPSSEIFILNQRVFRSDGTQTMSLDSTRVEAIAPGSVYEQLRDALCSKRPKWQKLF
jgi:hypothetical protein